MLKFAANLSMMFVEHPFLDRFEAAAQCGFDTVEFLFPYEHAPEDVSQALKQSGLTLALFNLPPGDWAAGERGLTCLPDREVEFFDSLQRALHYAAALGCSRLHAMAGIVPQTLSLQHARQNFIERIGKAAVLAAQHNVRILIEPINPHDMPRYFLNDFNMIPDLMMEIQNQFGQRPGLLFDIYHCARIHGDVISWLDTLSPDIAHYQIAGIPDRSEPNRGTLAYQPILTKVSELTPGLIVGGEYRPQTTTDKGLDWIDQISAFAPLNS